MKIKKIKVRNFKSIKEMELELKKINIFIGANGAGKSNFISLFEMLNAISKERLRNWVRENVGANEILYFGLKKSKSLSVEIEFDMNKYSFISQAQKDGSLYFSNETIGYKLQNDKYSGNVIGQGHSETKLFEVQRNKLDEKGNSGIPDYVIDALQNWKVYHFQDTSATSSMKQPSIIQNNKTLENDASNLAGNLFYLKQHHRQLLTKIENYVRLILPYFDKFVLEPYGENKQNINLEWMPLESGKTFGAYHFSDGTLRFICLATLLHQPVPPQVIIIDEPELGLHPYAITVLANMLKKQSNSTQIFIATQSIELINEMSVEDIIVVDNIENSSSFKRLEKSKLEDWLKDYSLGEIWQKNLLGGRP